MGPKKSRKRTKAETSPNSQILGREEKMEYEFSVFTDPTPGNNATESAGLSDSTTILHNDSPEYVLRSDNQQCQFPQYVSDTPQIPNWAKSLLDDIRYIKLAVTKIETIEKTVNSINYKVTNLEEKVKAIDSRVREVENSSLFISNRFDECAKDFCKTKSDIQTIQKSSVNAENTASELKVNTSHMQERITELECRAMRENLIFYGIAESVDENCEILVKNMCSVNLGIDTADTFTFDRAHRLGGDNSKKPRPIVVKFHYISEREKVRLKS